MGMVIPPMAGLTTLPAFALIDTSAQKPIFESEFDENRSSLDGASASKNYFGRIHKQYNGVDTTNIEEVAIRALEEQEQTFIDFIREKTVRKDTFLYKWFGIETKSYLGEVLQELQNSQESPNRKLLSKSTFEIAEYEARLLTLKFDIENILEYKQDLLAAGFPRELLQLEGDAAQKAFENFDQGYVEGRESRGNRRLPLLEILRNDRFITTQTSQDRDDNDNWHISGQLFDENGNTGLKFDIDKVANKDHEYFLKTLSNDRFVISWTSVDPDGTQMSNEQLFNEDGTKNGGVVQKCDRNSFNTSKTNG